MRKTNFKSINYAYKTDTLYLTKCDQYKDLTALFDSRLTSVNHIYDSTKCAYKSLEFMIHNSKHFSVNTIISLYYSLVCSKFTYGIRFRHFFP